MGKTLELLRRKAAPINNYEPNDFSFFFFRCLCSTSLLSPFLPLFQMLNGACLEKGI
eukprot:m.5947 g.5947  ORF g.5947 m.5947 type:complete len:57 (-) comp5724_c0_seq2:53-223(-)